MLPSQYPLFFDFILLFVLRFAIQIEPQQRTTNAYWLGTQIHIPVPKSDDSLVSNGSCLRLCMFMQHKTWQEEAISSLTFCFIQALRSAFRKKQVYVLHPFVLLLSRYILLLMASFPLSIILYFVRWGLNFISSMYFCSLQSTCQRIWRRTQHGWEVPFLLKLCSPKISKLQRVIMMKWDLQLFIRSASDAYLRAYWCAYLRLA